MSSAGREKKDGEVGAHHGSGGHRREARRRRRQEREEGYRGSPDPDRRRRRACWSRRGIPGAGRAVVARAHLGPGRAADGPGRATATGGGGERLNRGGWPVERREVALEGLAGAGIRGEEVGGGWKMIGAWKFRRRGR